jgi:hypothetical protein
MFGPLLRALQITAEQVAGVHWRMQTEPDDAGPPIGTVAGADEYADELVGILGEAAEPTGQAGRLDYFERFAGLVVAAWDEALHTFAADTSAVAAYRLPPEQAALLVGQISAAARRVDLRGRIAAALRARAGFHARARTSSMASSRISASTGLRKAVALPLARPAQASAGFLLHVARSGACLRSRPSPRPMTGRFMSTG